MSEKIIKLRHRLLFTGTVPPTELIVQDVEFDPSYGDERIAHAMFVFGNEQIEKYIESKWEDIGDGSQSD